MTARADTAPHPHQAPYQAKPAPTRRGLLQPTTLIVLLLVAAAHLGGWWALNRPVAMPDFRGQVNGLAFAPYQRGQSAESDDWPTTGQIDSDLRRVAPLTRHIRTYTVQNGFDRIPSIAAGLDLRVTLGSWLDKRLDHNAAEIRRLIGTARDNRNVERVMVGNEAVLRGDLTAAQLVGYIRQVRAQVRQPVSTAEPWHVWLDHPELGEAVDVITIHLLPYWEGLPIDDALRFIMEKYDAVAARFPGKPIVIGEVGWPSDGRDIGAARATRVNQAMFLRRFFNIAERRGLTYFVMEAFDQPWKVPFEGRAAGYWGMLDLDREAKWPLVGPVLETPRWKLWAGASTLLALLASAFFLKRRPDIRPGGKLLLAGLAQLFVTGIVLVALQMSETYLSLSAAMVWGGLLLGQVLLLALLLSDSFELAETIWGRIWKRRWEALPAPAGTALPKVSIHLPICNEPPHMVRQTLDALAELDYPDFEVLVVDNNTRDPALWEPVQEHCARLGPKFRFFHLGQWPGYKAGALNFALRETAPDAEVVGVLDSDYVVSPDWLRRMVPFFDRPQVGFVQNPQDYRDGHESLFKRMMFWEYAGFFRCGMVTRNERNAIIQHGTMTLIRRAALADAGGWAEWCICEDSELGLKLMRQGWEAVYTPQSLGRGVMPDDFAAYRKQRHRWAYGAIQIMKGHAKALFSPFRKDLTPGQRWHFVMGWAPWLGDALGLVFVLLGLVWSAGLIFMPVSTEFPILLFMLPSIGLFGFKLFQILALYAARVPCGWRDRLGAAVAGLALTHTIGKAVLAGLFTKRAPFLRTPKMANAPALVQGLVMAREELALLVLCWAAAVGVTVVHQMGTWEAVLWTAVLLVQSVPYLAAVTVSVLASLPGRRQAEIAANLGLSPRVPAASGASVVARSGEGL
ncbi:glycosyltransferase [Roseomonas sp. NAR14]|uniref:Beta-monoglucosyldiacylglycerol synthase n=1 Tax=Roseomonas acroporae TaxID=2937791 RepID=A0A9X1Y5G7_9PROT|nr:glycosyltransferase [Roseomonas acroporae]MCK8783668.1 glycosyltransferase [Roseomonas acroporae]